MRRMGFRGLAALAALLFAAQPVQAAWTEASSDHFLIYGDVGADRMQAFAGRLERFDQALRHLLRLGSDTPAPANRLTIYMVGGQAAVQRLCGSCGDVFGFYVPRASGPVAFTVSRAGGSSQFDLNADIVLLHEYAHHLLMSGRAALLPGWLNEGLAEFASTARIRPDGAIEIGDVALHRAYGLMLMQPMPLADLLTADRRRLSPDQHEQVYSRGWLLTHYLLFSTTRSPQLDDYLARMAKGASSLDAGKAAFGDLRKLDAELDRYKEQRQWKVMVVPAADLHVGAVALRPLRPGEAALMPDRMRSDRGVDEKAAGPLADDAARRAAPFADDPWVQGVLAEMEYDAGRDDLADAAADRALARDPKSIQALVYKGRIALRRAAADGAAAAAARWQQARGWLIQANHLEPDAAEPLVLYYDSFVLAHQTPSAAAKRGLERAEDLLPQDETLRTRLALMYLQEGKLADARIVLATLAYDPHAAPDNPAARLIALIDEGKTGPAILAEAAKPMRQGVGQ